MSETPPVAAAPGKTPTRLVLALVLLVLALAAVAVLLRAVLYFGPEPAPRDYVAERHQLALRLNGLDTAPDRNGWTHLQDALEALVAAEAAAFGDDRVAASETIESVRNARPFSAEDGARFERLREQAEAAGLFEALDRLAAAPGAVDPRPAGATSGTSIARHSDARALARFLAAVMAHSAAEGAHDRTLRAARHAIALARAQGGDHLLIGFLVEVAIANLTFEVLHQLVADGGFSAGQLLELHEILAEFALPRMSDILLAEKLETLQQVSAATRPGIVLKSVSRGHQLARVESAFDAIIETASMPPIERDGALRALAVRPRFVAPAPTLADLALPAVESSLSSSDLAECRLAAIRLHVAIEAFRARHGAYPDQLAQLVPEFFDILPTDPRNPDGIRYAVVEDPTAHGGRPILLYVVGFDGIDNDGAGAPPDGFGSVYLDPGDPAHDYVFNPPPRRP